MNDALANVDFVTMSPEAVLQFAFNSGSTTLIAAIQAGEHSKGMTWTKTMQMAAMLQAIEIKDLYSQLVEIKRNHVSSR